MDKRVILFFILLIYTGDISTVKGNFITSVINFFTGNHHGDESETLTERHKRITTDKGNRATGLEARGFRNGEREEEDEEEEDENEEENVRRSTDEEFEEILNYAKSENKKEHLKIGTRSLRDEEQAGKTKILEQRATLRSKNNDSDDSGKTTKEQKVRRRGPKFEKLNSREEKEMSSIKTLSSLSVPASKMTSENSGSGDDDAPLTEVDNWPKGRYGLPKSIFGCPTTFGFRWKTGFRYHDTEDDGTENQRSDVFHLAANFSEDGISHEFCIKDDVTGEEDWPSGKYCIYKRGPNCPTGLKEGYVIWDDENTDNQNDKGGALPEGEYSEDTKIYFCCSTNGLSDNQISLPAKRPFFLFSYESIRCQKVLNMKSTSEFIKFDDEDHGNTDYERGEYPYGIHKFQKDHMLFLCYYEPSKPVVSHAAEPALATNLEEDGTQNNSEIDQESLRQGEEMMSAFMKATGGVEDESNKKERTKTIIKTIKVPVRAKSNPIAIVIGLVLGSFVIGTAIIFIGKIVVHKTSPTSRGLETKSTDKFETTWTAPNLSNPDMDLRCHDEDAESVASDVSENNSASCYTVSENDSWSDLEEDDELVEDQFLADSELKTGLELLFLKQQRHYWNQRRRHRRRDKSQ